MTKFQKIQIASSIVPGISTMVLTAVTCAELRKRNSRLVNYIYLGLNIAISCLVLILLNGFIMTGQHLILNMIASGILLFLTNYLCVELQQKCIKEQAESDQKKTSAKNIFDVLYISLGGIAIIILLILLIVLLWTPEPLEDLNGADTSLAVLTRDEVLSGSNGWEAQFVSDELNGGQTNVSKKQKADAYDFDQCSFKCKMINGVKTMQITNIDSNTLTLSIESVLESGNLEIFILINNSFYEEVPVGQKYTTTLEGISGKDVEVRFAAEGAKMSINVIRDYEKID